MHISDEDLIQYLRGEVPTQQRNEIERRLAFDDELCHRLSALRGLLDQVESMYGVFEPPADLVEATLSRIDSEAVEPAKSASNAPVTASCLSASKPRANRTSIWDSTALTISLTVLCCLILPAIVRARYESRKAQCADNLRSTGFALIDFALTDPHQRFPRVNVTGPLGFAGVYAIHLKTFGVPITPEQLRCASLIGTGQSPSLVELESIPTIWEFSRMAWNDVHLQGAIGGDYAYNLGVREGEAVVAPRYAGRSRFAILGDSPIFVGDAEQLIAHDGFGSNILFEDGHVAFLDAQVVLPGRQVIDHPYRNMAGVHAVGLFSHDASLAPSQFSPLGVR